MMQNFFRQFKLIDWALTEIQNVHCRGGDGDWQPVK
jgi:hypothetical protein